MPYNLIYFRHSHIYLSNMSFPWSYIMIAKHSNYKCKKAMKKES